MNVPGTVRARAIALAVEVDADNDPLVHSMCRALAVAEYLKANQVAPWHAQDLARWAVGE